MSDEKLGNKKPERTLRLFAAKLAVAAQTLALCAAALGLTIELIVLGRILG